MRTGSTFRTRTIDSQQVRTSSQKLFKTGKMTMAFNSVRKPQPLLQSTCGGPDSSEVSAESTENKSLQRNNISSRTQSTNVSSKLNSDSIPQEPNNCIFLGTTPTHKASPGAMLTNSHNKTRSSKKAQKICALNVGQVMTTRWLGVLKAQIPQFDLDDTKTLRQMVTNDHRRQSAAEYSQHAYMSMLEKERAIGNYFELPRFSLRITPQDRESMVSLI